MAYRNKDACIAEAKRLGIEGWEEMSWPDLQKAVSDGLKREELGVKPEGDAPAELQDNTPKRVKTNLEVGEELFKQLIGQKVIMSPELQPERYRLTKYDEDLGPDYDVVERQFDIDPKTDAVYDISGDIGGRERIDQYHDYMTGTYRLKKRSDRRVVGMASVPKENPGREYVAAIDWFPVVTWRGRRGYSYGDVKRWLKDEGYYAKYRERFIGEPNVWYAAGVLVCNRDLVHQVMQEITEDKRRREEQGASYVGY